MKFAVLQKNLEIPAVEKLRRAFRSVPTLTDIDAHILGNDAFGILVKGKSLEHASVLQQALALEGIETEVVAESELVRLPEMKFVQRIDCGPDALMIYDPLGRAIALAWENILLIAAGNVRLPEFNRIRTERKVVRYGGRGQYRVETEVDYNSREEMVCRPLIEIVLKRAVLRYSINAEKFNFMYLGARKTNRLADNFRLLAQDIISHAPRGALNRGAYTLREGDELFAYPSKNAFHEEMKWILWRMKKAQAL